jgi:hypothetical protein
MNVYVAYTYIHFAYMCHISSFRMPCRLKLLTFNFCLLRALHLSTDAEGQEFDELISAADDSWLKKPRRLAQELDDINSDDV